MRMRTGQLPTLAFPIALLATTISAQQPIPPAANPDLATYDSKREVTLLGTVQSFTPLAQTPPLGAHLILQTPAA